MQWPRFITCLNERFQKCNNVVKFQVPNKFLGDSDEWLVSRSFDVDLPINHIGFDTSIATVNLQVPIYREHCGR